MPTWMIWCLPWRGATRSNCLRISRLCAPSWCGFVVALAFVLTLVPGRRRHWSCAAGLASTACGRPWWRLNAIVTTVSGGRACCWTTRLRVTSVYKHLGVLQAPVGGLRREVASRGASSAAACAALSRSCLSKAAIPISARAMVARACMQSRGLYQAGCWPLLSKRQFGGAAV